MAAGEDVALIATLITILFSVVVLGWALLYKCTDATMIPGDFTFDKCFTFFPKSEKKLKTPTEVVDVQGTNLLEKSSYSSNVVTDNEDEDYTFISNFNEMNTRIYGTVYNDISARSLGECAKICYENQVPVGVEGNGCGGFTSEDRETTSDTDRVYCRLYEKGNLSDSTLSTYEKRSFYLKGTTLRTI